MTPLAPILGLLLLFAITALLAYRYRAKLDRARKERDALLHTAFWHRARVSELQGREPYMTKKP